MSFWASIFRLYPRATAGVQFTDGRISSVEEFGSVDAALEAAAAGEPAHGSLKR